MKKRIKILGITLNVLFWLAAILLPVYYPIGLTLLIVVLFFIFWLAHILKFRRHTKYFKLQLLLSPVIILLVYGIGLGIGTYAFGNSSFFYSHTHYYDKTGAYDNNLDPKYRINYVDHRGNYYGPLLWYSWGTLYYYYFNDITLISLTTVFGPPWNNYKGPFPTFEELKQMNSFKFDSLPIVEPGWNEYHHGKILIRNKIVEIKKQYKMQEGVGSVQYSSQASRDSIIANGGTIDNQKLFAVAYTKYYPLIIFSEPYMSRASHDFGGKLFFYDCEHEKYVAEMLIPDSNYYNMYVKE
jgi:hypothetical protein